MREEQVVSTTVSPAPAPPLRLTDAERVRAGEIADTLGERASGARWRIGRVVVTLGAERTEAFVARTRTIEAAGGLRTRDGTRRRTPGGVFLHLVRAEVTREERVAIFGSAAGGAGGASPEPAPPAWGVWNAAAARAVMALSSAERGEATSVKITVTGRPGKVVERDGVVAVALAGAPAPPLPKGVPAPPAPGATRYVVLIARKQWAKVAAALTDPNDLLIAEGYPALEARFAGAIAVYTTRAMTKRQQMAQKAGTPAAPAP